MLEDSLDAKLFAHRCANSTPTSVISYKRWRAKGVQTSRFSETPENPQECVHTRPHRKKRANKSEIGSAWRIVKDSRWVCEINAQRFQVESFTIVK